MDRLTGVRAQRHLAGGRSRCGRSAHPYPFPRASVAQLREHSTLLHFPEDSREVSDSEQRSAPRFLSLESANRFNPGLALPLHPVKSLQISWKPSPAPPPSQEQEAGAAGPLGNVVSGLTSGKRNQREAVSSRNQLEASWDESRDARRQQFWDSAFA